MNNKYVKIETPEYGVLLVKKTRGELRVEDVMNAIRDNSPNELYALFLKAPEFDGWLGEDKVDRVVLHNVTTCDQCPVCRKALDEERGLVYEAAFQDGYQAAMAAAQNGRPDAGTKT